MPELQLAEGLYLCPTPAGAYHAVVGAMPEAERRWLLALMSLDSSPPLHAETLRRLAGAAQGEVFELLQRLQRLGLVQGLPEALRIADQPLQAALSGLLARLAGEREGLLADDQGFCLAAHGLPQEQAEELAALAAELCKLRQRYASLLAERLPRQADAWALVGAGGYSDLGFWPLRVGAQCFVLALGGRPVLNQQAIVELIWRLVHRYGAGERQAAPAHGGLPSPP